MDLESAIRLSGKIPTEPGWQKYCSEPRPAGEMADILKGNYGIPCGPANNLIVIDVDNEQLFYDEFFSLPETFTVKTGRGFHLYFTYDSVGFDVGNRAFKAFGIDIRAKGGYVVGPGSIHPETNTPYTVINDTPPKPIPYDFRRLIAAQKEVGEIPTSPDDMSWDGDVRSLPIPENIKTLILEGADTGQRSEAIMSVLNALAAARLSDNQILGVFQDHPIGDKAREKNNAEAWLLPQITNARAYAAENFDERGRPEDDFSIYRPPGYFVDTTGWAEIQPEPIDWIFTDLLATESVGFLAATGGTGKSYMMLEIAINSIFGRESFDLFRPARQMRVMAIMVEDPEQITRGRLFHMAKTLGMPQKDVEAAMSERLRLRVIPTGTLALLDHSNPAPSQAYWDLKREVDLFQPDLLILDPKSQLYGLNENDNDQNTFWVNLLKALCSGKRMAAMFSHHMPKNGDAFSTAGARGGSALADASRLVMGMQGLDPKLADKFGISDPENYTHMRINKCSYAALPATNFYFQRGEGGQLFRRDLKPVQDVVVLDALIKALLDHYDNGGDGLTERDIYKSAKCEPLRDEIKADCEKATRPLIKRAIEFGLKTGRLLIEHGKRGKQDAEIVKPSFTEFSEFETTSLPN